MKADPRYQFLPDMATEDFERLKESIAEHGFLAGKEVEVTEDGRILDGHNRARACAELGITCPTRVVAVDEEKRWDYVYISNVPRRHMTRDERVALVREYIRRHSEESDRAIAAVSGTSPTTVGKVRREMGEASPEGRPNGQNVQEDYQEQHAENYADHRNDVWFELTIGYAAPSEQERKRGGLPYAQASQRTRWESGRMYLVAGAPLDVVEFEQLMNEIKARCSREVQRRSLATMAAIA